MVAVVEGGKVCPNTMARIDQLCQSGIAPPKVLFTIAFHSGSELEVGCADVEVTVEQSPDPS